jgi:histidinol dehydrogenase
MINWTQLSLEQQQALLQRPAMSNKAELSQTVSALIDKVKSQGDDALIELTEKFDGVKLKELAIPEDVKQQTLETLTPERKAAIELAYNNITRFHEAQQKQTIKVETTPGVICELRTVAIKSVGLYIPGGSAPLPSTVLMLGVPAQIAGCRRAVLCTPPDTSENNFASITPEILYAAELCGIREIYRVGGAQAVAALAYGTDSIEKVDKIYGPGNSFVTEAKQQVNNDPMAAVIDMPAGPSEVLIIADASANPAFIAADLLSQAEHGPDSQVILVCDNQAVIEQTQIELENQLALLPRADIAKKALANSSLILTESLQQSVEISNEYAPEHLIVQTEDAYELLPKLENAASIFVGAYTPESAGDYASGTNHVLPTYGYSKSLSSLNLDDFCRKFTVQTVTKEGMRNIGPAIEALADAEGLDAHKYAVSVRLTELNKDGNKEG